MVEKLQIKLNHKFITFFNIKIIPYKMSLDKTIKDLCVKSQWGLVSYSKKADDLLSSKG